MSHFQISRNWSLKRSLFSPIRMFPKIGVPQKRWFIMENPIKMDDLGGNPLFLETPIWPTTNYNSRDRSLQAKSRRSLVGKWTLFWTKRKWLNRKSDSKPRGAKLGNVGGDSWPRSFWGLGISWDLGGLLGPESDQHKQRFIIPLAIPTLKWGARAPNLWKFYVHQNCSKTVYHISQKYELILERQKNRPTRQQVSILERTTVRQKCQF